MMCFVGFCALWWWWWFFLGGGGVLCGGCKRVGVANIHRLPATRWHPELRAVRFKYTLHIQRRGVHPSPQPKPRFTLQTRQCTPTIGTSASKTVCLCACCACPGSRLGTAHNKTRGIVTIGLLGNTAWCCRRTLTIGNAMSTAVAPTNASLASISVAVVESSFAPTTNHGLSDGATARRGTQPQQ